jgi:hypothetical protein
MAQTLEEFAKLAHDTIKAHPGPAGRVKVCEALRALLADKDFVAKTIPDETPDRKVIYEDPEFGFCILAHHYRGAKESTPHDHGPSWAIYGQAVGQTDMTDWSLVQPASGDTPGKVRKVKTYSLTPGMAYVYNEGDLHSPSRKSSTKLIRIEGLNMEKIKRAKFEEVAA